MPKMQIVTDEMLNRASKIGQDTTNILEKQNMVTNIFRSMGRNFSGKIPSLMTQHMLGMEKEYKTMNGILTNYKDFLEDSAYNYDWKEDELARFAESLGEPGASSSSSNPSSNTGTTNPSVSTNSTEPANGTQNTQNDSMPSGNAVPADTSTNTDHSVPDFTSGAYDVNIPGVNKYISHNWYEEHNMQEFDKNGTKHINCLYYARARAMEVNEMSTYQSYPSEGSSTEIRSNSVAYFHDSDGNFAHAVYVERYDAENQIVYFTEGNWGTSPDGEMKHCSLAEFNTRGGLTIANYDYYPPA